MTRATGSCTGGWGSKYSYYLDYTLNSQSVANNTSNITLTAWAQASATNYQANNQNASQNTYKITADGTVRVNNTKAMDFRNRAVVSLGSWTGNVSHNSDGTRTIAISANFTISGTSSLSGGSVSTNWTLPTIARASIPTLSSAHVNLGSAVTISTNRASSSFTHTIEYFFGNTSGVAATGVESSFDWILPNDLAYQLPTANSGDGILRLWTYSGGTTIGYKDAYFTAYVPTESSTFNPTATDLSISIHGNGRDKTIGKFVEFISRVDINFTPTARMGAWVSATNIHIGRWYSGNSITSDPLAGATSLGVTAQVIDSRGRVAEAYGTVTLHAYQPPKITSFNSIRVTGTTNAVVSRGGIFSYLDGSNPLTLKIERQEVGTSTWDIVQSTNGDSSGIFDGSVTSTDLSDAKSYSFRLTVSDSFGKSATANATVSTAPISFTQGKTGIGAGKVWERGSLDAAKGMYLDGKEIIALTEGEECIIATGDWNDYTTTGFYMGDNLANQLNGESWRYCLVMRHNPLYVLQVMWDFSGNNMGMRVMSTGIWLEWRVIISSINFLNYVYPIGSIYMSMSPNSPSTLFGGTWVALYDRFLVGAGSSYGAGGTGGESVHTLTKAEMPSHDHGLHNNNTNSTVRGFGTTDATVYATSARTQLAGGGEAHNNMPPYLAVYMWKRTA